MRKSSKRRALAAAIEAFGKGEMATVRYIVRERTAGGAAPASGCDAGHAGSGARVPYGAAYLFFRG